ncbi:hypothetical protein BDV11DRAFT_193484 [Aspergillus similis]
MPLLKIADSKRRRSALSEGRKRSVVYCSWRWRLAYEQNHPEDLGKRLWHGLQLVGMSNSGKRPGDGSPTLTDRFGNTHSTTVHLFFLALWFVRQRWEVDDRRTENVLWGNCRPAHTCLFFPAELPSRH